jgi:hypothetical protein
MTGHTTALIYSTAIFLALLLGGLMVLRRQRAVGTRMLVFLVFCFLCTRVTMWTSKGWQLLMGETAIAWITALLLVAGVEVIRVRRSKRAPA